MDVACRHSNKISTASQHAIQGHVQFKVTGATQCFRIAADPTTDCLTKNGFDERKCTRFVDLLYECCQAFYEKNGDNASTVSCPKANLLRLKIEQRKNGIQ
ncbi:hypothetical protein OQA88_10360 [Cercophora sp. LCS_1]